MERRRDFRHGIRYRLSVKCLQTRRVVSDLATADVSASGLSLTADAPHGLREGDRLEVRLFARIRGALNDDTLVMATDAVVIRSAETTAALRFEAPLAY